MRDFYKREIQYKTEAVGPLKAATRFSCRTANKIYDVTNYHIDLRTGYEVDGRLVPTPTRYHKEVIEHFSVETY